MSSSYLPPRGAGGRRLLQHLPCPRRGMTLIELLSAIAIIALLLAIALPFYSRARAGSDAAVCRSNLRQMANAALMFVAENEGRLPYYQYDASVGSAGGGIREFVGVGHDAQIPDLGYVSPFTCPSLQKGDRPSGNRYNKNYATNGHTFDEGHREAKDRIGLNVANMRDIHYPGATALYMCGRHSTQLSGGRYNYSYYVRVSQWREAEGFLQFPHGGRQHVAFWDGHVEGLREAEAPTDSYKRRFWTGGAFE